jgi:Bacterial SH3 domain
LGLLLLLAFSCASAETVNQQAAKKNITQCAFGAFSIESDPAGLNVRQAPSLSSKVIGVLPPAIKNSELDNYTVKTELDVVGSHNGWIKIAHAGDNTMLTGKPARPVFSGSGWVSGRKLTVKSQASFGYAEPNIKSPYVLQTSEGSFDNDELMQAGQMISCQNNWALMEFSQDKLSAETYESLSIAASARKGLAKGHFRAWLYQLCGIQETSCSGTRY